MKSATIQIMTYVLLLNVPLVAFSGNGQNGQNGKNGQNRDSGTCSSTLIHIKLNSVPKS